MISFKLRTHPALSLPSIGLGTYAPSAPPGAIKAAVIAALHAGCRHIDTAYSYGSEEEVGEGIRESGVRREEVFVTTKLFQTFHRPEDVKVGLERSLRRLGLEYVDLFLMHFPHAYIPGPDYTPLPHPTIPNCILIDSLLSRNPSITWAAMQDLLPTGLCRAIGVSNFSILKLRTLLAAPTTHIIPAVNQVELHPYLPQPSLLKFCRENGIHVTAHSPLGGVPAALVAMEPELPGPVEDEVVKAIARERGWTPQEVLLAWAVTRGTSVVPKSIDPERIRRNLQVGVLTEVEMEMLEGIAVRRRRNNHKNLIGFDIFDEERDEPVEDV
ncbi:aldo-keto reductase [Ascodesmis nigricans]|uniref:Aldo-keto reductase n=1 Tax=Ascodesmis nigricans TaxID=341454 RepID=A0A4S2N8Q2_9PEZI|nr:aldo-keto reductase [Ascodesmis nigricans]